MTKNTMGSFISALRKANGLTQKELAEKLNVSDKAVSRWERDEACPDLMLIPLIADTFGVTSDELLRGERNKAGNNAPKISETPKKRIDIILKQTMSKFNIGSIISLGVSVLAFILHISRNLFSQFFAPVFTIMTAILITGAFICQKIFTNDALSSINTDAFKDIDLNETRKNINNKAWGVYTILAALTAIFIAGIAGFFAHIPTITYELIILAVIALTALIINSVYVLKSKTLLFTDSQKKRAKLKLKLIVIFAIVAAVTAAAMFAVSRHSTEIFAEGTTVSNSTEFSEFFDVPDFAQMTEDNIIRSIENGKLFFDHPINKEIHSIKQTNGGFPIKIYTQTDYENARGIFDKAAIVFVVLFCIEAVSPFIIYFTKRKSI